MREMGGGPRPARWGAADGIHVFWGRGLKRKHFWGQLPPGRGQSRAGQAQRVIRLLRSGASTQTLAGELAKLPAQAAAERHLGPIAQHDHEIAMKCGLQLLDLIEMNQRRNG